MRPPLLLVGLQDFNPRSPCGERLAMVAKAVATKMISIHAPRVGSDRLRQDFIEQHIIFQSTLPVWGATADQNRRHHRQRFQSTLPVWGATRTDFNPTNVIDISIHAPRVGSDFSFSLNFSFLSANFNPRSPCGERPVNRSRLML